MYSIDIIKYSILIMKLIQNTDLQKYINDDISYLITFIKNGNIHTNLIEQIYLLNDKNIEKFINNLTNKLKKYNPQKYIDDFYRDIYYNQIRDKNNKLEKIYECNLEFINSYDLFFTTYLMESQYKTFDNLSFPNLNKYHSSTKILQYNIKIENIHVIIENFNIFVHFTNANNNILCDVINTINLFFDVAIN